MDALSPYDPCERVVCLFSSQAAKTEIGLNWMGYIADQDPGPMLIIQPNVTPMAEAFSKDRVATMIRDTPVLRTKIADSKARDSGNTMLHKGFAGGHWTLGGANSPAGLASRPIRYFFGDEINRWEVTKEGSPLSLARKRQLSFHNRKELLTSSPTFENVGIDAEFKKCQQQYQWQVKCPDCGEYQYPQLKHFEWSAGVDNATYACEHCGVAHPAKLEDRIKRSGMWVCLKDDGWLSKGYQVNQWGSPLARWRDTINEWRDAQGDRGMLQAVINTAFCENWKDAAEEASPEGLLDRRENYTPDAIPADALLLTAGVDVQGDRLEVEIVGWRAEARDAPLEQWGVQYIQLAGSPTLKGTWDSLDDILRDTYLTQDGRRLKIIATCIDAGGHHAAQVYAFCGKRRGRRVYAVLGRDGKRPIWPVRQGKSRKHKGGTHYIVGVDAAKDLIYAQIRDMRDRDLDESGPGCLHWPALECYDKRYFEGLTCEVVKTVYQRGHAVRRWEAPQGARNEPLDLRVYALAALMSRPVNWGAVIRNAGVMAMPVRKPPGKPRTAKPEQTTPEPPPPEPRPSPPKRPPPRGRRIRGRMR